MARSGFPTIYGPYVTHFDAFGYEIGRLTPYQNSPNDVDPGTGAKYHNILGHLPSELGCRKTNKGMEGLAVTPDGRTLVGIMQSALQLPDKGAPKAAQVAAVRIVTIDLRTYATRQYVYVLDFDPAAKPGDRDSASSEITALSNTRVLVDERDGKFEPGASKKLYVVDITGATDVSGIGTCDIKAGKSSGMIEASLGTAGTADAKTLLGNLGITPVNKQPYLDLGGLVTQLNPTGAFYAHDKVEGVATHRWRADAVHLQRR